MRVLVMLAGVAVLFAASPLAAQDARRARATELASLGVRFAEAGDRVSGRAYLRDAITADPSYAEAYVELGELELARASFHDAEATFRVGLVRAQPDVRLWIGLARSLVALGADDDAEAVLAQADAQLHDDPALLAFRAERAEARGRWSVALALARRMASAARSRGETERASELEARARALAVLVGSLDPVRGYDRGTSSIRSALADR
ncbi:MAG: hypothetical protein K1X94_11335 [Sandaracinaceae bacterium]|nr:hypothetical protein [Sandaracinaceae bacterium]